MLIKTLLKNYKKTIVEIKEMEIRIKEIELEMLENYSTKNINIIRTNTNKINNQVENSVIQAETKKESLSKSIKTKELLIKRIENALNILNEKEYAVIELIYLKNLKIETVLYKLNRSYKTIKAIEKKALEKMEEIIKSNY